MAIHPYLIRFKPVDTFFFGGERSFGYDGERTKQTVNANYFVLSNRYPQQTTLLGTLRYKLLEAKGWLATAGSPAHADAGTWIGPRGFTSTDKTVASYGHIHALSPLFWLDGDTPYLTAPFDRGIAWQWQTAGGKSLLGQAIRTSLPLAATGYDPKQGIIRQLVNQRNEVRSLDDVYAEQTQEGILKLDKRTEDEQGFYKQTYYRFRKTYKADDHAEATKDTNWAFGVVAWLADEAADLLMTHLNTNGWATLGGEGRPFRMTMTAQPDITSLLRLPATPATDGPARLTLLSDACVANDIYDLCAFAISETVDFRSIETTTKTTSYANLNRSGKGNDPIPKRGHHKQLLLERGSVLYVHDGQTTALRALLDKPNHFRRIGYNAYTLTGQPIDQTLFIPNQPNQ